MLPPVLEIYVVWHPDDPEGDEISRALLARFRGTTFSGLIGGAVEVYVRSASATDDPTGAPRALPSTSPLPYDIPSPALTAIVLVGGLGLDAALHDSGPWRDYVSGLVQARDASDGTTGLFLVTTADHVLDGPLGDIAGRLLGPAHGLFGKPEFNETLCRDVAQGIAQMEAANGDRVTVFVSHTKRRSVTEDAEVSSLIALVRSVIADTRLDEFFDAHDLQVNEDWAQALEATASTSALLAVRTDLYSTRPWCQREMLIAKRMGMPVVILDALTNGEERGSFVMDHVPRSPGRQEPKKGWRRDDVVRALGQLVDECLKRVLWRKQRDLAEAHGLPVDIDWWAPHAPEPLTFLDWLDTHVDLPKQRKTPIVVLHPDPPLGPDETEVLEQVARLASLHDSIEFLTPRGLAARGG